MFLRFITLRSDVEIFSAMQWYFFSRELMFIYLPQRLIEMLKVISLPKSIVNNESIHTSGLNTIGYSCLI